MQVNSPRIQSLLAYLLLHEGPQPRRQLAYLLWPESSESQARTNLRNLLYQLRQTLPDEERFLSYDSQTIQWSRTAPFRCDALELRQRLTQLDEDPLDEEALVQIGELYTGELLPDCYDDWIVPLRNELHEAVKQAMGRLLLLLENRRAYDQAIRTAQQLLALDPLDEEANRRLMRLRALNRDRVGALLHYQQYVALLRRELDVDPDGQTQILYDQIVNRTLTVAPAAHSAHLPADQLPLVGRDVEQQQLQRLWQTSMRSRPHLVLIAGVAGIGKTRLAEELLHWAGHQGALVARTRSYSAQGAMAYAPVADLLRTPALHEGLRRLNEQWLAPLVRILPELLDDHPNLPQPEPMLESWQRHQFQEALVRAAVAHEQPLLLLLDDLQWCDAETLAWVERLLRSDTGRRLLIVGAVRSDEVDTVHPLAELQLSLRRDDLVTEVPLQPLSAEETALLARQVTESTLDNAQIAQIFADTEGNPLFVVETVRAQKKQQADTEAKAAGTGLPPKVYMVIKHRGRGKRSTGDSQHLIRSSAADAGDCPCPRQPLRG